MNQLELQYIQEETGALSVEAISGHVQKDQMHEGKKQEEGRKREVERETYLVLMQHFQDRIRTNSMLGRKLVSSQDDKQRPFYRWFRYREGFSSKLVSYLLAEVHPRPGALLDPFAGSAVALFSAASLGWQTRGFEVLPVGAYLAEAHITAAKVNRQQLAETVEAIVKINNFTEFYDPAYGLNHVAITRGAFSEETEKALTGYLAYCHTNIHDEHIRKLALFACFCILEEISYTRKDGQYLRWDYRSGRTQGRKGKKFAKAHIAPFSEAIRGKLDQIACDLNSRTLFEDEVVEGNIPEDNMPGLILGSCLEILPTLEPQSVDVILTSPPYCNRYDYTRTYALELVFLGSTHEDITGLRQRMLSCTVENKEKRAQMKAMYTGLGRTEDLTRIEASFFAQVELQRAIAVLESLKDDLPNSNIIGMVRNYFYEMCFVIFEMARILAPGGHIIMVNDNVQYEGQEIAVDLVLSSIAESFGLAVETIWTLDKGKGNSSQQMGTHGRNELRKGVYVWAKPTAL